MDIKKTEARTMMRLLPGCLFLFVIVVTSSICRAGDIRPIDISRLIDQRLGIVSADKSRFAGDAEFLRRVTLDLAGRIPTIAEVHAYLGNASESRRVGID